MITKLQSVDLERLYKEEGLQHSGISVGGRDRIDFMGRPGTGGDWS